jgi:hypothetical protein
MKPLGRNLGVTCWVGIQLGWFLGDMLHAQNIKGFGTTPPFNKIYDGATKVLVLVRTVSSVEKVTFIIIFLRRKVPGLIGARTRDLRQHRLTRHVATCNSGDLDTHNAFSSMSWNSVLSLIM